MVKTVGEHIRKNTNNFFELSIGILKTAIKNENPEAVALAGHSIERAHQFDYQNVQAMASEIHYVIKKGINSVNNRRDFQSSDAYNKLISLV